VRRVLLPARPAVGVDGLATWAEKIGLGAQTGIDLPQERAGLIPTTRWYDKRRGAASGRRA
jgi:penicillin-binding protein 2